MQQDSPLAELEALLDAAATQLILGDATAVASALANFSLLAARVDAADAAALATQLEKLAVAQTPSDRPWLNSEDRRSFEKGLTHLRQQIAESSPRERSNALNQDRELVGDFILESREHLQTVESDLLILEKDPTDADTLNAVFRRFHTIKGLAGFLEFEAMQMVAHEIETILDLARTGGLLMRSNLIDLTLESADYLSQEISRIEEQLSVGAEMNNRAALDASDLLLRVRSVIGGDSAPVDQAAAGNDVAVASEAPVKRSTALDSHTIRVDTAKLDHLLDMVGEMVIAESMVRLDPDLRVAKNPRLHKNLNQLRRVTAEVQKIAMATRLIPVGALFQRVHRLVRDTCRKAGKLAEVELMGEDTQLDKSIIEELSDPLMHMVRNSIDHGIESPVERRAAAKPSSGRIQLKAYRQADHIQIEITDDGRGLDRVKILAKAKDRGLLSENAQPSDAEMFQLIFEPGFSTADHVTGISGRGVGMDVVKRQILKLRGKIEIQSKAGSGTTFYLKLPLTLAIVEGLVIGVGVERYILPLFCVQEMFRAMEGQVSTVQGAGEMVLVRNQLLPLIRLHLTLGVRAKWEDPLETLMIVAETEGQRFVLMVDDFIGKQEVVIKSLGASLRNTPGIAGGAILGDGRVGLILDLETIYRNRGARAGEIKGSVLIAC